MSQLQSIDEIVGREAVPSSDTVRERFGAIDGLRALAIVSVLTYEIVRLAPALVAHDARFAGAAFVASQGFSLFLILSGFSLAYPAIVARTESGRAYLDIGRFIVKRLLRIYPAYLLALILTIVVPPLALRYGLPALAGGTRIIAPDTFWRNALFVGDGLGNDGFLAVGIVARCYLVFPLLLLLWSRSRVYFPAVFIVATLLDLTTSLHGIGIGALVPFGLGIVAAEVRAQDLPAYRFGLPLALVTGLLAMRFAHGSALQASAHAPGALYIDPLWSIALFGIVVAICAFGPIERVLSFPPLRLLGATSFAISLVLVPVSAFAIRQLSKPFGVSSAAFDAVVASLVFGFALYRVIDRTFGDGPVRREAAARVGPLIDRVLERVYAHRIVLGDALPIVEGEIARPHAQVAFYAPPPRPDAADLAIVSTRTGTPEDLAAEILATKKRLSERSAAFFATPSPAAPPPIVAVKPGFYRKPKALATAAASASESTPEPERQTYEAVGADRNSIKMRVNGMRDGATSP